MKTHPVAKAAIALALSSCAEESTVAGTTTGGDATTSLPTTVEGGVYQLSVVTVDDGCLEGALELVFKPNGGDAPYPLQNPTTFPAADALPASGLIELEAPFSAMPVTWEAGAAGALAIRDGVIEDVLLGLASSPDCTADLAIDVDVSPTGDGVAVDAAVTITGVASPTETCPVIPDGCLVSLELVGQRVASGTANR